MLTTRVKLSHVCRVLTILVLGAVVVMLVTPLRNNLVPVWLRPWRQLSNLQAIKVTMKTLSSHGLAALVSCTEPGKKPPPAGGGVNPHQLGQAASAIKDNPMLRSNPPRPPRRRDVELYSRAMKWVNSSTQRKARFGPYLPLMTIPEKAKLLDTWRVFHDACTSRNISYFFVEGTLLGAIRHKGMIPWDDDIDIAVDVKDAQRLQHVLSCIPGYTLRVQTNMHWKFFAEDGSVVLYKAPYYPTTLRAKILPEGQKGSYVVEFEPDKNVVMRFPFLDIFLMKSDGTYTRALTSYIAPTATFLTENVYPLATVPFEDYLAPVPRRSREILRKLHDVSVCKSPFHNHKFGFPIDYISSVPCEDLAEMYPIYRV